MFIFKSYKQYFLFLEVEEFEEGYLRGYRKVKRDFFNNFDLEYFSFLSNTMSIGSERVVAIPTLFEKDIYNSLEDVIRNIVKTKRYKQMIHAIFNKGEKL